MSKRKGLSVDEKLVRLKELFHETKDVFTLKQLEPLAQKQKGIVSQSVKEILAQLTADNIVQQDKIGVGTYFWSFPSANVQNLKIRVEDLDKDIAELKKTKEVLLKDIAAAKVGREESEERASKLRKLDEAQKRNAEIKAMLRSFAENDPEVLEMMEKDSVIALAAANRWTDNVFTLKKVLTTKFNVDPAALSLQFGLPADFDYPLAIEQ